MNTAVRKTYAEFLLPDPENPGEVMYSLREVPYANRSPKVLPGRPIPAIGVRFFDQLVVDVVDPQTNEIVRCSGPRLDVNQGTTFYDGEILTQDDIKDPHKIGIKVENCITILTAMQRNQWNKVIYFSDANMALSFNDDLDEIYTL